MDIPEELKSKSDSELEEWFLSGLSEEKIPFEMMLQLLGAMADTGGGDKAHEWADLLQETLVDRSDGRDLLSLLVLRGGWGAQPGGSSKSCQEALRQAFDDRLGQAFVKNAGWSGGVRVEECLRRLVVLTGLKPGVLCYDGTWGFGVVREVDDFYEKVTVDFSKKKSHQMSLAYAGETLERLEDDHLMARRHRDPDALSVLVKENPAEVVRIALRSYGPLSAPDLRDRVVSDIVSEADWKRFWDAARKTLKADPLVDMPAKRSDAMSLRAAEREYGSAWFEVLKQERDLDRILQMLEELYEARPSACDDEAAAEAVTDRVHYTIKAAGTRKHMLKARVLILSGRLGITVSDVAGSLLGRKGFLSALRELPAKELRPFIDYLSGIDQEVVCECLLSILSDVSFSVLNHAIEFLVVSGKAEDCGSRMKELLVPGDASVAMIQWLCRHMDTAMEWHVVDVPGLVLHAIDAIELTRSGDELKAQNQLRLILSSQQWLEEVLAHCDGTQRRVLVSRVNGCGGWDASDKRSVLAKLIKLDPGLADAVSDKSSQESKAPVTVRMTSWRSYQQRQQDLKKLVEVDIPTNSREIARARSYGDLRENAEYKAAKEYQGILHRRRGEMEADLRDVRGTGFEDVLSDRVGMGTCVTVEHADGGRHAYCVLGEWDRDEALGIISSKSRLAEVLDGCKAGESVVLPGNELPSQIVEITGLSGGIRDWLTVS